MLGAGILVASVEAALLFFSAAGGVRHGVLLDPDCYMHLQRAYRLMTGGWQSGGFDPRINAPFGYAIHWTMLFDALLAAGAAPLHWLGLGLRQALYLWGSAISPLLLVVALAVFARGVRPWIQGPAFLWLVLLLFTQPELSEAFLVGRADHHSLMLGLLLAQIAWLYASIDGRAGVGRAALAAAFAAGIGAGIQLCTTVEGLLSLLLVSLVLAIAWVWLERPVLKLLLAYWSGGLAMTLAWLLMTRWQVLLEPAYDRVSIVHAAVLAVGVLAILLAMLFQRTMPRLAALCSAALMAATVIGVLYPDFFLGPWPHLDPAVRAWHREIGELQPLVPGNLYHAGQFLRAFTASLLALPLTIARLKRGSLGERAVMLTACCGFLIFGVLALAQMRWSAEMQAVMLVPWTLTTQRIMQSTIALKLAGARMPLRGGVLMAAVLLQVMPEAVAGTLSPQTPAASPACDWHEAARALSDLRGPHGLVMTELWGGPEILWRSRFDVVGAPYEMAPAIADTARFEHGTTAEARQILTERHVDYVLTCGARADAKALGLTPVAFAAPGFRLYRVAR